MTQLSIIVPVYNVENYIRPCIESIFNQGLDESYFEVIIVNDDTEDKSMEMIADIIKIHNNITVINQENLGVSVARNNGIEVAKGQYILMIDSDDLLIENSLKPVLEIANKTQVDIVVADYLIMTNDEIKNLKSICQDDFTIREMSGEHFFEKELDPRECYIWHILFKREFLIDEKMRFYPGIRYQDVPFIHECYLKANKCLKISLFLIVYRKWSGASTSSFDIKKAKDFSIAISKTWDLTQLKGLSQAVDFKLREDVWTSFCLIVFLICRGLPNSSERNTAIDYLRGCAPNLYFKNGAKQHFLSFLFNKMPHALIMLRYFYGIIFEDRIIPYSRHILKRLFR